MAMARKAIADGSALNRLAAMVKAQGGDPSVILDPALFAKAPFEREVKAVRKGYLAHMNTEQCGIASSMLGAGRITKESQIDYTAGIALKKKVGQEVEEGETIAILYTSRQELFDAAEEEFVKAVTIAGTRPEPEPLIYARVTREGVKNLIG